MRVKSLTKLQSPVILTQTAEHCVVQSSIILVHRSTHAHCPVINHPHTCTAACAYPCSSISVHTTHEEKHTETKICEGGGQRIQDGVKDRLMLLEGAACSGWKGE